MSIVLTLGDWVLGKGIVCNVFLKTSLQDLSLPGFAECMVRIEIGLMNVFHQKICKVFPY